MTESREGGRRGSGARTIVLVALALGVGALAGGATVWATQTRPAAAAGVVFTYDLPSLPGQRMTGVLVEYEPGATSRPHHHTDRGSVAAYVLGGEVRSQVNGGPVRTFRAGESWFEPPGAAHNVSENASATEPASILAIFVADAGAELTTVDP